MKRRLENIWCVYVALHLLRYIIRLVSNPDFLESSEVRQQFFSEESERTFRSQLKLSYAVDFDQSNFLGFFE